MPEKTVAGIKTTLEAEPAPEEDAPATKPVAEAVGEVVDAAAGDDHKDPAAVAEAKAQITAEAEKAQREEAKKDEDEDKVPKYVLTKYERIECEAVWNHIGRPTPSPRRCRRDSVGSRAWRFTNTQV